MVDIRSRGIGTDCAFAAIRSAFMRQSHHFLASMKTLEEVAQVKPVTAKNLGQRSFHYSITNRHMREIKFRAWSEGGQCWVYFSFEELTAGTAKMFVLSRWGQFTGRKDKNAKEIYEGDIVKVVHEKTGKALKETIQGAVIWSQASCTYRFGDWKTGTGSWTLASYSAYEVIGNTYENPDLLKK